MKNSHASHSAALIEALASDNLPHLQGMGRRQRRAAETRVRLFRCALQLFAERGFPNVTVEDITETADVGKGTFFNYFESKDHVLGVMAEIQLGKVREALTLAESGKQTTYLVLHRLFLRVGEEPGRSPDLARALISSFLASESVRGLIDRNLSEGREIVAQVVAAGQKRGEIDPRLKKEKVAIQLQQAFMGTLLLWSLHGKPALETWIEESFQHFWRAIAISG
ncbi:MAG TPA: TetR/AcrR family transcriptional regulator [Terriglobales bacterium]|jgi:AcrR family transcriptional regulator|nr:TetR/AcrR family transcriptional regulator [Terriglobales bacterium]